MAIYTKDEQLKLIDSDWRNLNDIDNQYADVCIKAINKNIQAIQYVKKITKRIISVAMKKDWTFLKYVKQQTPEMCLEVVKNFGHAINFVKEQTPGLCLEAVKGSAYALASVKDQTEEICLEAIKNDGTAIKFVKNQTPKICLEAVKQNGLALQYVKNQTEEICLEAVKQNGWAILYVKEQTEKICLEAVKQNECAIDYIKNLTEDVCLIAVKKDGASIYSILEKIKKDDISDKIYFFAFLNYSLIYKNSNFKHKVDNIIKNEINIENTTFCINDYDDINDAKDYYYFERRSFLFMKDLLINKNSNNRYIFNDKDFNNEQSLSLLKEFALSNNELIIVDTGNIKDIHRLLANRIIKKEELKKGIS